VNERPIPDILPAESSHTFLLKAISYRHNTFRKVPPTARKALISAVRPALQTMVGALQMFDHARFVRALQCFMIVPQFALSRDSNRPPPAWKIRNKLHQFLEGVWLPPKPYAREENKHDSSQSEEFSKSVSRAMRLAQEGNVKKASAALETAALGLGGVQAPHPRHCGPTPRNAPSTRPSSARPP